MAHKPATARRRLRVGATVLAVAVATGVLFAGRGSAEPDHTPAAVAAPPPQIDFHHVQIKPLVEAKRDVRAPLAVPARARTLLSCLPGEGTWVGENPSRRPEPSAAEALGRFVRVDRRVAIPKARYRHAGAEGPEVLFTVRAQQRLVGAVVVAEDAEGWTVRTFGFCRKTWHDESYQAIPLRTLWTNASDGLVVDQERLSSRIGPGHCDQQSIVALRLNVGSARAPREREFVRDPEGLLGRLWNRWDRPTEKTFRGWPEAQRRFDPYATLPPDAVDTGFRRTGIALWVADDGAYLVGPDRTERWAEVGQAPGCM